MKAPRMDLGLREKEAELAVMSVYKLIHRSIVT